MWGDNLNDVKSSENISTFFPLAGKPGGEKIKKKIGVILFNLNFYRTEDLVDLSQRTVVEPLKKLSGEFAQIQVKYFFRNLVNGPR